MIDFASARIAILGTGREGRAAWRWLRARHAGIELTLIDEKEPDPAFARLLGAEDRLITGPLETVGLQEFDVLVRSPGISIYRDCLRRALAAGVTVTTPSSLWFSAHRDQRTICITGTKGKSTTSALLAHVLASQGYAVRLAGNIGKPLLECDDLGVDWWVIELSSYQLADLEAEPTLAVLLNLSPEHLDWHGDAGPVGKIDAARFPAAWLELPAQRGDEGLDGPHNRVGKSSDVDRFHGGPPLDKAPRVA